MFEVELWHGGTLQTKIVFDDFIEARRWMNWFHHVSLHRDKKFEYAKGPWPVI
jgi:hypothetical protein